MGLPVNVAELLAPGAQPARRGRHPVELATGAAAVLEVAEAAEAAALFAETDRLRWLDGRAGTPRLLAAGRTEDGGAVLLVEHRPGLSGDARQAALAGPLVATALGRALAALHGLPPEGCPAHSTVGELVATARERVAAGLVTQADLTPVYRRFGPDGLLSLVERSTPPEPGDDVVCHAALQLTDLVLFEDGEVGLVRLGRLTVADRCLDLSAAIANLLDAFGPEVLGDFVSAYGMERPAAAGRDVVNLLRELL